MNTALLHGFGTSRELWRPVLEAAPETLVPSLLALDLMGFGDAAPDGRAGQTTADMAGQVAGALRADGRGPYRVAGHSMGGKVALLLAARWPDLVSELLLVAPSPPTPEPMTDRDRADLKNAYGHPDALTEHYRQVIRAPVAPQDMAQLIRDGQRASQAAWTAWPEVGSRENVLDQVAGVQASVTVLFSEDDPAIHASTIRADVLDRLPGARSVPIRGTGHMIPLERPQAVLSWLTRADSDPQ